MPRRSAVALARIVERMATLSPSRHRELMRGMVAELDSIADSAERTRFALGAIAAIARLTLSEYARTTLHALGQFVGVAELEDATHAGGSSMPELTTRQLLRRHAIPFAISFTSLTLLLLAQFVVRHASQLSARGVSTGAIAEMLLLAVPFILAMTMPMAVFLAVSWVFMRLGAEGVLASARRERHGVRRVVAPVLSAAAVIATLTLVSNTQVLPRTNARLVVVLEGVPRQSNDRTMTVGELREAARMARVAPGATAAARAAAYEVEIQKKFALAAACVVLALVAAATSIRFPRAGLGLVLGASTFVFTGYYFLLVTGESLADRQVISPSVAMWTANASLLAVALLLAWSPSRLSPPRGTETLVLGG